MAFRMAGGDFGRLVQLWLYHTIGWLWLIRVWPGLDRDGNRRLVPENFQDAQCRRCGPSAVHMLYGRKSAPGHGLNLRRRRRCGLLGKRHPNPEVAVILPPDSRPDRPRTPSATAAHLLQRLPLAHAALALFRYALDPTALDALFDRHRGRYYEDVVTFPNLVAWLFDALTDVDSGRQAHRDRDRATAPGCDQAFYAKLRRLPVSLAVGFLQDTTARLAELFPVVVHNPIPPSLRRYEVLLLDGKALKHVAKRLAATRGTPGQLLGGKLLVAYRPRDGQVIDFAVNLDGEGNEAALVPELAARLRDRPGRTTLFVADRQFSSLKAFAEFACEKSRFVVRHAETLSFTADPARPAKTHRDTDGRVVTEEWGWVGQGKADARPQVRRVSVTRAGDKPLSVLTDLLDAETVPAVEVLAVYRMRWDIEGLFRDVTEVFALGRFVGSTAEATVFQASLCFVLSNLQAVLHGFIAADRQCGLDELSVRQIRGDWHRQLIALKELTSAADVAAAVRPAATVEELRAELTGMLMGVWRTGWAKTRNKTARPHATKARKNGAHTSVVRRQQAAKPAPGP